MRFPQSTAGPPLCLERSLSHNVWGPVLSGNVGSLVQQLLRISLRWKQNSPRVGPSKPSTLWNQRDCTSMKPALRGWWISEKWGHGEASTPKGLCCKQVLSVYPFSRLLVTNWPAQGCAGCSRPDLHLLLPKHILLIPLHSFFHSLAHNRPSGHRNFQGRKNDKTFMDRLLNSTFFNVMVIRLESTKFQW